MLGWIQPAGNLRVPAFALLLHLGLCNACAAPIGFLQLVSRRSIVGWAIDPDSASRVIDVELQFHHGGRPIARSTAVRASPVRVSVDLLVDRKVLELVELRHLLTGSTDLSYLHAYIDNRLDEYRDSNRWTSTSWSTSAGSPPRSTRWWACTPRSRPGPPRLARPPGS